MKTVFLFLILVVIGFASCTKEEKEDKSYWGYTNGSTFTYSSSSYDTTTSTWSTPTISTQTVVGDTMINGNSYKKADSGGGEFMFSRHKDGVYYQYLGFMGTNVDLLYLKDNLSVGNTWNQTVSMTFQGFPISVTITYSCLEKGSSLTIGSNVFTNVVKISQSMLGAVVANTWYAKGIGLIKTESYSGGQVTSKIELTAYTIM